jgi:hypothetical protein
MNGRGGHGATTRRQAADSGRDYSLRLACHSPGTRLDPNPRIPSVQHLHPARHRALDALNLAAAAKEATLEPKHGLAALPVDGRADDEQAVRVARPRVPGGISTANNNLGRSLLNNLEVVGELCARLIRRPSQLISRPQLSGGSGPVVLAGKIRALESVT